MLLVLPLGRGREGQGLAQHKQNTEEQSFVPRETGESVRYNTHSQHRIKPFSSLETLRSYALTWWPQPTNILLLANPPHEQRSGNQRT